jgi:hypothetical protein
MPTNDNCRFDNWLGSSPVGKKRSWKVKSVKTVIPAPSITNEADTIDERMGLFVNLRI